MKTKSKPERSVGDRKRIVGSGKSARTPLNHAKSNGQRPNERPERPDTEEHPDRKTRETPPERPARPHPTPDSPPDVNSETVEARRETPGARKRIVNQPSESDHAPSNVDYLEPQRKD